MGIKKSIKNFIATALIAGSMALAPNTSQAGFIGGIDGSLGWGNVKLKSPNGAETVSVSGYTGTGKSGSSKTYDLAIPSEKSFSGFFGGFAPYIGYRSSSDDNDCLWDFRIGKEFNFFSSADNEIRQSESGRYYLSTISDNAWGYWPNAGVYADVKRENIFFIDKTIAKWGDKREGITSELSLIMKLNKYQADYNAFTARTPYGSEWYGSLENTITSSKNLGEKSGYGANLGLRADAILYQSEFIPIHLFADCSFGIPMNDFIQPAMETRAGVGLEF